MTTDEPTTIGDAVDALEAKYDEAAENARAAIGQDEYLGRTAREWSVQQTAYADAIDMLESVRGAEGDGR